MVARLRNMPITEINRKQRLCLQTFHEYFATVDIQMDRVWRLLALRRSSLARPYFLSPRLLGQTHVTSVVRTVLGTVVVQRRPIDSEAFAPSNSYTRSTLFQNRTAEVAQGAHAAVLSRREESCGLRPSCPICCAISSRSPLQ